MAIGYKQKCTRCRKNYVPASWKNKFPVCYDCQKIEMQGEIKDPKMKELFDIPEEYYKENSFLRNIKISYNRYGKLTERQIEVFKDVVKKVEKNAKKDMDKGEKDE